MAASRSTRLLEWLLESKSQEIILVRGNRTLSGSVAVSGAKNSALKLMAASLLASGKTTLCNIPLISDIDLMSEVMRHLGARVVRDERDPHTLHIDTQGVDKWETPYSLVSKMRASISTLGPLIGRFGSAKVAMPGGCRIGARKIDMHLVGLHMLGVDFKNDHGSIVAQCNSGLHGNHIVLDFPSVGATENTIMAAVVADGVTQIDNAASEPEIVDLCAMLNAMGAVISGAGTSQIKISGVPRDAIHPCQHTCLGDRIEAGTFLVGGALTGGPLTVEGVDPANLRVVLSKLRDFGCDIETTENAVTVSRTRDISPANIQTLPYPGFPTDLQAQFMLLANYANGVSIVTENVFENRFMFAAELTRMGADIRIDDQHAIISGPCNLCGAPVSATDLRAGGALALAGIMADGYTKIYSIKHIDRGYENYVGKLSSLGADIERCLDD